MKNHIIFKFVAIALCALALMGMLLSAGGIAVLALNNWYTEELPDWKESRMELGAQYAMEGLAGQYIINTYYNEFPDAVLEETDIRWNLTQYLNFDAARTLMQTGVYYTIHDQNGQLLDSTSMGSDLSIPEGLTSFSLTNRFSYPAVLAMVDVTQEFSGNATPTIPQQESTPVEEATESTVPTAISSTVPAHSDYGMVVHDHETNRYYDVYFVQRQTELLTVTLYADLDAVEFDPELVAAWQFLEWMHENRFNLIWMFAASALLFAILAVYLCCAAGKKPGTPEIKPAGFNAMPLDLYAVLAATVIVLLSVFLSEVITYGGNFDIADAGKVTIIASTGYGVCLVFVAFCFACAAQFKMPDSFFLRRSLAGMVLIFSFRCIGKVLGFLKEQLPPFALKRWAQLSALCQKLWQFSLRFVKKLYAILRALCQELWKLVCQVWAFVWKHLRNLTHLFWRGTCRFFDLLPMTWQWLLVGIAIIFMLFVTIISYNTGWILLAVVLCLLVVLYGAHAFGILMEAAQRMGGGDLDTKVSDQFLLGSFKDFARHLNALADVAVVAAQKQMKSERMKTELITNVSHDIKTPLTSIINYVDLLQLPHSEEDEAQYLEVLGRKSQQLKKLIDDLMEMSKASTGNLTVDIRQVDAVEAINQALGEFSDKLAAAPLTPVFQIPAKPVLMKADGRLAWRVLSNLLGNTVKYALPGTRLYIDVAQAGGKVLISMKNISREPLNVTAEELMERFVRGDASRNTEGSGLGLNIAKSLMEVQHGQLQLLVDGDLFKATLVFPGIEEPIS